MVGIELEAPVPAGKAAKSKAPASTKPQRAATSARPQGKAEVESAGAGRSSRNTLATLGISKAEVRKWVKAGLLSAAESLSTYRITEEARERIALLFWGE